jgi:hypothetical protein
MPSATECALLVAIPADEAEFRADFQAGTDFVRSWVTSQACGHVTAGWRQYAPYAQLCADVTHEASERGVTVCRRATLGRFVEAIPRFAVVTLIAHSRGPEFTPGDVLDLDALLAQRAAVEAAASHWIARATRPAPAAGVDGAAAWLNELLDAGLPPSDVASDGEPPLRLAAHRLRIYTVRWKRRRAIEAAAGSAIAHGVGFEFFDGFHELEAIDRAIPEELTGTLDLTVCDSTNLAELLRARRSGGIILSNSDSTSLDFRLALYRQTLGFMVRRDVEYADAARTLRRHLKRSLCRL